MTLTAYRLSLIHLRGDITANLRRLVDSIEATLSERTVRLGRME